MTVSVSVMLTLCLFCSLLCLSFLFLFFICIIFYSFCFVFVASLRSLALRPQRQTHLFPFDAVCRAVRKFLPLHTLCFGAPCAKLETQGDQYRIAARVVVCSDNNVAAVVGQTGSLYLLEPPRGNGGSCNQYSSTCVLRR